MTARILVVEDNRGQPGAGRLPAQVGRARTSCTPSTGARACARRRRTEARPHPLRPADAGARRLRSPAAACARRRGPGRSRWWRSPHSRRPAMRSGSATRASTATCPSRSARNVRRADRGIPSAGPAPRRDLSGGRMATILVVDDRPSNRDFLVTLLGYLEHRPARGRRRRGGAAAGQERAAGPRDHRHPDADHGRLRVRAQGCAPTPRSRQPR